MRGRAEGARYPACRRLDECRCEVLSARGRRPRDRHAGEGSRGSRPDPFWPPEKGRTVSRRGGVSVQFGKQFLERLFPVDRFAPFKLIESDGDSFTDTCE